jgi:transposase-like protein
MLLREIRALGYVGTGRRHEVSDNAIRKWLRQYQSEGTVGDPPEEIAAAGIASAS